MRYWHGLGRCENPASQREIEPAHTLGIPIREGVPHEWGNYVYLTPVSEAARAFTALAGGRAVVEVETGAVTPEPDPDFATLGLRVKGSVNVVSVTVLQEHELPNAREITQTLGVDYTWEDGQPRYTSDGYLQFSQGLRNNGWADTDLRWLGQWWPFDFLIPGNDGRITAITDDLHCYVMFPAEHPAANGHRRVPQVNLSNAWTSTPGYHPPAKELMRMVQAVTQWNKDARASYFHMPWD
ncbi:hypothetical protein [Mycobacteroides abscessus]|uniref:hypothetical protein n=1 Tax=Mycobacteroides abscessus TaxID=36809 RepID=UPI0009D4F75A|nr:hypothetical protein [Mycobacteroides abscessus]SKI12762.1 Uncharacterised protein [Mycobacteroides abscessus subsp. massiliense]SKM19681.1 Uncharacterised protein [Mycobacteroides abscessus subsp. massiliense]SLD62306.1 Uncharacterised protein [Mycobacteroides abscessus subsp. massiliense]SLD89374.1 Uncharacterised protein [Mycobacteroides abscessus subsp. massiliense]SLG13993.1 Uncharacterised protein [Mycobacteroides abscessus subsp. massiliense]